MEQRSQEQLTIVFDSFISLLSIRMEGSSSPDSKVEDLGIDQQKTLQRVKKETGNFKVGLSKVMLSGFCSLDYFEENTEDIKVFDAWKTLVEAEGAGIADINDAKQVVKTNGPFWERRFTKFKIQTLT